MSFWILWIRHWVTNHNRYYKYYFFQNLDCWTDCQQKNHIFFAFSRKPCFSVFIKWSREYKGLSRRLFLQMCRYSKPQWRVSIPHRHIVATSVAWCPNRWIEWKFWPQNWTDRDQSVFFFCYHSAIGWKFSWKGLLYVGRVRFFLRSIVWAGALNLI